MKLYKGKTLVWVIFFCAFYIGKWLCLYEKTSDCRNVVIMSKPKLEISMNIVTRKYRRTLTTTKWMSSLPSDVVRKPLNTLAIPGSHNSFSYTITQDSKLSEDLPKYLKLPWVRLFIGVLYKWSVTQDLNVTEQLQIGVRYFDCRISCPDNDKQNLYFVHGLLGDIVDKHFQEMARFLNRHPREVVVLDFNHFYGNSPSACQLLVTKLGEVFAGKMMSFKNIPLKSFSLYRMWNARKQVIVFGSDCQGLNSSFLWPNSLIFSPFIKTVEPEKLLSFLEAQKVENSTVFTVYQGVLNPFYRRFWRYFTGSLREDIAVNFVPRFSQWIENRKWKLKPKNIFMTDYVYMANFTQIVIGLNFRKLS